MNVKNLQHQKNNDKVVLTFKVLQRVEGSTRSYTKTVRDEGSVSLRTPEVTLNVRDLYETASKKEIVQAVRLVIDNADGYGEYGSGHSNKNTRQGASTNQEGELTNP